jgi:hypothetical protein
MDQVKKSVLGFELTLIAAALVALLSACVSKDCPAGSVHVAGKCALPDAGPQKSQHKDGGSQLVGSAGSSHSDVPDMSNATTDAGGHNDPSAHPDGSVHADGSVLGDAGAHDAGGHDAATRDAGPCNGETPVTCWKDADKDGFAASGAKMATQCSSTCAEGWTATEPKADKIDCDDGNPAAHPGVTETCNGVDDDCDSNVDENATSTCTLAHATATCDRGSCKLSACADGYADCDADATNGCEQSLNDHDHCGACGQACAGAVSCTMGKCGAIVSKVALGSAGGAGSTTCASLASPYMSFSADELLCWGSNAYRLLSDAPATDDVKTPSDGRGMPPVRDVAVSSRHMCVLQRDADVVTCWGDGGNSGSTPVTPYWLGSAAGPAVADGTLVGTPVHGAVEIAVNSKVTCARTMAGAVTCWGLSADNGSSANGSASPLTGCRALAAGEAGVCAVLQNTGDVQCWGGAIGNRPTSVVDANGSKFTDATAVAVGFAHVCVLHGSEGKVACWATVQSTASVLGGMGQLGRGTVNVPNWNKWADIDGLSSIVRLAAGFAHTCALDSSGHVHCFGRANAGELGLDPSTADDTSGTAQVFYTPRPVPSLADAVAIYAGGETTCAVRRSGQLVCMGMNDHGQIGDGTTANRYMPVNVLPSP